MPFTVASTTAQSTPSGTNCSASVSDADDRRGRKQHCERFVERRCAEDWSATHASVNEPCVVGHVVCESRWSSR
jgi:hypothetical protein